jgi:hypothetical protein
MVRMKNTQSKGGPQGEELPTSTRKITRMEQEAKEAKGTFLEQFETKGKVVIDRWEREVNTKRQGKSWAELIQEVDGIRDPGATQPRKTLYHKTVEEAWRTKMMISKLRADKNETSRVENHGHKKELIEIMSCLSMERLAGQVQLYLRYVHHMDITPADQRGTPACIIKTCTVEQKKENEESKEGDESHPILLD